MIAIEEKRFEVDFQEDDEFSVDLHESGNTFPVDFGPGVAKEYRGSYRVTPGAEEQTLSTAGMTMTDNVTVEAIPNNYGLITWDGHTITVS